MRNGRVRHYATIQLLYYYGCTTTNTTALRRRDEKTIAVARFPTAYSVAMHKAVGSSSNRRRRVLVKYCYYYYTEAVRPTTRNKNAYACVNVTAHVKRGHENAAPCRAEVLGAWPPFRMNPSAAIGRGTDVAPSLRLSSFAGAEPELHNAFENLFRFACETYSKMDPCTGVSRKKNKLRRLRLEWVTVLGGSHGQEGVNFRVLN